MALLLGAGVDQDLRGAASWADLVLGLFPAGARPPRELSTSMPVELALVARQLLGDERYFRTIDSLSSSGKLRSRPLAGILRRLAEMVPLIVTTNYSDTLAELLRPLRPVVLDRTSLHALAIPEPGVRRKRPVLLHLHGRSGSSVLDRAAYDEVEFSNSLYSIWLNAIFERWTVVAYGCSMSDPPIRVAASRARAIRPETRHTHVWIDRRGAGSGSALRHRARASLLAHSLHRIEVPTFDDAACVLDAVSRDLPVDPRWLRSELRDHLWRSAAEALDRVGDYEADAQKRLFPDSARLFEVADALASSACPPVVRCRLERHLRHHLYLAHSTAKGRVAASRKALWEAAARGIASSRRDLRALREDATLARDFCLGLWEVRGGEEFRPLIDGLVSSLNATGRGRLRLAPSVWPAPERARRADPEVTLDALRRRATLLGWESLEAKVTLDLARAIAAKRVGTAKEKVRKMDRVLAACQQAIRAAQIADTRRRVIGAIMLRSLWTLPTSRAIADLRSAISLFEGDSLEPALRDGLAYVWSLLHGHDRAAFMDLGWPVPGRDVMVAQAAYWHAVTPDWLEGALSR